MGRKELAMSKLNVRTPSIIVAEAEMEAKDFLASLEAERGKKLLLAHDAVLMTRLDELHEEVIENWSTASRESVEEYEALLSSLSDTPTRITIGSFSQSGAAMASFGRWRWAWTPDLRTLLGAFPDGLHAVSSS
jgi:hypothetical protein